MPLIRYLQNLSTGRIILWCYFIWWGLSVINHFDPSPRIWLTSLGLSGIIGVALLISTQAAGSGRSGGSCSVSFSCPSVSPALPPW